MQAHLRRQWDGAPVAPERVVRTAAWLGSEGLELRCRAPLYSVAVHPTPPGPTPRLWESEVVEWFIAGADGAYTEVELGPFGNHLVLQFSGYREPIAERLPIRYRAEIRSDAGGRGWRGRAVVPVGLLPPAPHRLNVCAIQPGPVYLQWRPGRGERPDFHVLDAMVPVDLGAGHGRGTGRT